MRLVLVPAVIAASFAMLALAANPVHATDQSSTTPTQSETSRTIIVKAGDCLSTLATAYNTTIQRLYDANPAVQDPNLILVGESLRVPGANEELAHREMPAAPAPAVSQLAPAPVTQTAQPVYQAPAATPAPVPRPAAPAPAPAVASGSVWDELAQCESGGNWAINSGNGFYGGLQFTLSSWQGVGGSGYPNQASREEQIMRAQTLQARQGWGAWPACSAKLGLR